MNFGIVPMAFRRHRYLIIRDKSLTVMDELSEEILGEVQDETVRVVDMETFQEVMPDMTTEDLVPEEPDA